MGFQNDRYIENNTEKQIFLYFLVRYNVICKTLIKYVVNSSCRSGQIS